MTGVASIRKPYTIHRVAPTICTARSAAGREKKYDPTNTAVATHPRICVTLAVSTQPIAGNGNAGASRIMTRSVRARSQSRNTSPLDSNSERISEVRNPNTW